MYFDPFTACQDIQPGFRSCRFGIIRAGVSREWRRHVRAQFQSRCNNLAIHRACFETATQRTGHGCLLRGTNPLASLRKGRPRLAEYVSIAESGLNAWSHYSNVVQPLKVVAVQQARPPAPAFVRAYCWLLMSLTWALLGTVGACLDEATSASIGCGRRSHTRPAQERSLSR